MRVSQGRDGRLWGKYCATKIEAARGLIEAHSGTIPVDVQNRVLQQARDSGASCHTRDVPQASPSALSQGSENGIQWVHQIYGLFGDNEPMSDLFASNMKKWQALAAKMGAAYQL